MSGGWRLPVHGFDVAMAMDGDGVVDTNLPVIGPSIEQKQPDGFTANEANSAHHGCVSKISS